MVDQWHCDVCPNIYECLQAYDTRKTEFVGLVKAHLFDLDSEWFSLPLTFCLVPFSGSSPAFQPGPRKLDHPLIWIFHLVILVMDTHQVYSWFWVNVRWMNEWMNELSAHSYSTRVEEQRAACACSQNQCQTTEGSSLWQVSNTNSCSCVVSAHLRFPGYIYLVPSHRMTSPFIVLP